MLLKFNVEERFSKYKLIITLNTKKKKCHYFEVLFSQ